MKRLSFFFALLVSGLLLMGADGCSSDPNVEGAKLDLKNKNYDRALENVETAIANDPQNAEAYKLKGDILFDMIYGQGAAPADDREMLVADMLEAYNEAAELDPEYADDLEQWKQLAYGREFNLGVQAFDKGQTDESKFVEAAEHFDTAADIMPDSSGAYLNEAFAYLNAGMRLEAIEPLEQVVALEAAEPTTYVYLAELYGEQERGEEAIVLLEGAQERYPENESILTQLLNAYVRTEQMDRAMDQFSRAVERNPDNALYRYNYGSLLLQAERYEEAAEQLQRAVELEPDNPNAQYNLGATYINRAVEINDRIAELDDQIRGDDTLTRAQEQELQAEIDELIEQAADRFGVHQPRVSDFIQGRIGAFTIDAPVNMLPLVGISLHIDFEKRAAPSLVMVRVRRVIRGTQLWLAGAQVPVPSGSLVPA